MAATDGESGALPRPAKEITMKTIREQLFALDAKLPRGMKAGTSGPRAPWNTTGRRLWHVTDENGREIARAATPAALLRLVRV